MNMKLRQSAVERLVKGIAPATRGSSLGTEALTLLHGLASTPQTASDALKLLHELQVHQVELDLQHEQAEQECRQLAEDKAGVGRPVRCSPKSVATAPTRWRPPRLAAGRC